MISYFIESLSVIPPKFLQQKGDKQKIETLLNTNNGCAPKQLKEDTCEYIEDTDCIICKQDLVKMRTQMCEWKTHCYHNTTKMAIPLHSWSTHIHKVHVIILFRNTPHSQQILYMN